ncbi:MAG: hypothetical protein J6O60_09795 [Lachnospiraceae bacterium]|nr:hypothetical protein [Lachnospiraceae bacterium]
MNYEQFKERFIEDLKSYLEARGHDTASIDITPTQKLNQEAYDAISVKLENSQVGPGGNFSNLFAAYEKTGDYEMILNHATKLMDEAISNMQSYDANQLIKANIDDWAEFVNYNGDDPRRKKKEIERKIRKTYNEKRKIFREAEKRFIS